MERRKFLLNSAFTFGALFAGHRAFAQETANGPFPVVPLPYPEDALVPYIDARTMRIHHNKHYAGYTRKLNAALQNAPQFEGCSVETILGRLNEVEDPALRKALRDNGGGYYNHTLFWEVMAPPDASGQPSAALSDAMTEQFGSIEAFREAFTQAAATRFGSGWAWLILRDGQLEIISTPNQDNPLMAGILPDDQLGTPLLGLDVWEHAYYLKYQNQRGLYIDSWWNVVNWDQVNEHFASAA